MKTIKFFLVSLFMMLGLVAQAQQVVINKTDGTVEVFQTNECDSIVYDVKDYGYYSFNATSLEEIKNLTSSDFTKLTKAISEVTCGKKCYPVVLTTGKIAPVMTWWSLGGNGYGAPQTMDSETDYSGLTITISDKIYNVWCLVNPTSATDTTKVKIEIK